MKKLFLFLITLSACIIPDMVILPNQPDTNPTETWYEQTWEFGPPNNLTTAEDKSTWDNGYVTVLSQLGATIQWDRTSEGMDPTGSSSVKITFDPTGSCCGIYITLPDAKILMRQEIWHEQWIKYSSNWDVSSISLCASPTIPYNGHKTIWWYSNNPPTWRHEFLVGMRGDELMMLSPMSTRDGGLTSMQIDERTQVWDGQWHRWRFYLKRSQVGESGWYTLWLDDQLLHDGPEPPMTGEEPPYWDSIPPHWSAIQLSRNMRCPPPESQSMWFGRTVVYNKNPNWN